LATGRKAVGDSFPINRNTERSETSLLTSSQRGAASARGEIRNHPYQPLLVYKKGLEKVVVAETGECCKVKDTPIAHLITPVQHHQNSTTIRSPQTLSCEIRVSSESTLETSFAQGPQISE
jgi:hypothetical protein